MPTSAKSDPQQHHETTDSANIFVRFMQSPLLWGGLLTVGFYSLIPYLPRYRELAERYFCGHPLEYATSTLFFTGIAILAMKWLGLGAEKAALSSRVLLDGKSSSSGDPSASAAALDEQRQSLPSRLRHTYLAERLRDACAYVRDRGTSEGLEDHLKYLAELAAERLHGSYALVRTITWAVPILGFLGTVMGITIAIANLNFQEYESSMQYVIAGLAVAFDTTTLALALSLLLVFCAYVVERSEQEILVGVEDCGLVKIPSLFPSSSKPLTTGFAEAEAHASRELLDRTESLISQQTDMWQESIESMRDRWSHTLDEQSHSLAESLRLGQTTVLTDHAQQLAEVRQEFLHAFHKISEELNSSLGEARLAQIDIQESFRRQLAETWLQVREDISALREEDAARADQLLRAMSDQVAEWQTQLAHSSTISTGQLEELRLQRETLLQVVTEEQQLKRLQNRLVENLESVRAAESFEETLHSLSAAVHLLTTRVKPKAA